ncbi:phospholemman isoform X3 [Nycticebus coucang]|uniref:phospholemman isoform X3 n=1 Tax=Nycticebus coucang TaxID=9470 RepID=UPI00234E147E|nr:phospholemman isoform X3 [Nycticebus coucang]XP_053462960.1 phospholemman isoform X3 [Nycticebus coucang]
MTHSPMTTAPCESEASSSLGSSSSWASLSCSAKDAGANSTSSRRLGNLMKRRELSAAPSAVCPAAGGRNTWRAGTQPGVPGNLTPPIHHLRAHRLVHRLLPQLCRRRRLTPPGLPIKRAFLP